MKLMFASDIHILNGHGTRLSCSRKAARWLVILGDVLNHGPRNARFRFEGYAPARAAERLNAVATQIIAVARQSAIAKWECRCISR